MGSKSISPLAFVNQHDQSKQEDINMDEIPDDKKPEIIYPAEGDFSGTWNFMSYFPKGCEEIKDCEMDLHILKKEGSAYQVDETRSGECSTDEAKQQHFAFVNFKSNEIFVLDGARGKVKAQKEAIWLRDSQRLQIADKNEGCYAIWERSLETIWPEEGEYAFWLMMINDDDWVGWC